VAEDGFKPGVGEYLAANEVEISEFEASDALDDLRLGLFGELGEVDGLEDGV